jgi:hypothetical protein
MGSSFISLMILSILLSTGAQAVIAPKTLPLYRLEGDLHYTKIDPRDRYLAFTNAYGRGLRILHLQSGKVFELSKQKIGDSFFWAPDGHRLFFREIYRTGERVESRLMVHDIKLQKTVALETVNGSTGKLTYDPRDMRFLLMHENGIMTRKIVYPDQRLARWQRARRRQQGRWVIAQQKILWLQHGGLSMRPLTDDSSGLQAFDISPDGSMIVWSTEQGQILVSRRGQKPFQIAQGRDPRWHPVNPTVVFAQPQSIGSQITQYDLAIVNLQGQSRLLTRTPNRSERWPTWTRNGGKLLYTIAQSTDLFAMDFQP